MISLSTMDNAVDDIDDLDFNSSAETSVIVSDSAPLLSNSNSNNMASPKPSSEKEALRPGQRKNPCFVFTLTFFSAIGGFLFGYDTGVVSGAMLLIKDYFHLSSVMQELVVSVTIGAAAVFALVGGFANDYLGRKLTTVIASVVFTVGAICLGAAQNTAMLISGRLIVGAGIGIASMTVPVYIAESAPAGLRGRLVTLNTLFVTGGQFIASLLDGVFSYNKETGWRYMLGLAAIPSFIQFIGFLFMPESPRWLVTKGHLEKAKEVLRSIRGTDDVQDELSAIQEACDEETANERLNGREWTWLRMLKTPHVRRALIVGSGLQLFQQLGGINTVMYYSATIIKMAGVKKQSTAIWLSALTAGCNFVFTLVGVWLVERIGRKQLVLGSVIGVTMSLGLLAVGFQLAAFNSPPITLEEPLVINDPNSAIASDSCAFKSYCESCIEDVTCGFCYTDLGEGVVNGTGSCLLTNRDDTTRSLEGRCNRTGLEGKLVWAYNYCPTSFSWMAILGLAVYLMCFAPGMGPMPWTVNSEIYPTWARSTGNSISTAVNWSCNLLVSMTFLTLTESITKYGTYWLYTGISVLAIIFIAVALPETKGKTLEEVEELFEQPWCGKKNKVYSTVNIQES